MNSKSILKTVPLAIYLLISGIPSVYAQVLILNGCEVELDNSSSVEIDPVGSIAADVNLTPEQIRCLLGVLNEESSGNGTVDQGSGEVDEPALDINGTGQGKGSWWLTNESVLEVENYSGVVIPADLHVRQTSACYSALAASASIISAFIGAAAGNDRRDIISAGGLEGLQDWFRNWKKDSRSYWENAVQKKPDDEFANRMLSRFEAQ